MEVTDIRHVRRRVTLTIGTETVTVSRALYRERPIQIGEDVDLEEYGQWILLHQYRPALDYALTLLGARAFATGELHSRLTRAGYAPQTADMVLFKLEKVGVMDDEAFAKSWAEGRMHAGLGRSRIAQELRCKGIGQELIARTLDALDGEDQAAEAVRMAQKGLRRAKPGEDPRKTDQRVLAMLARRGYRYDEAKAALETAKEEEEL